MLDPGSDNDGRFPYGSAVLTPYPLTPAQERGDRAGWPWLAATVAAQVGPDEWEIAVEDRRVAVTDDGTPAPGGTPEGDLYHPVVFRDASELRCADGDDASADAALAAREAAGGRR